jgi:hypothetical protein
MVVCIILILCACGSRHSDAPAPLSDAGVTPDGGVLDAPISTPVACATDSDCASGCCDGRRWDTAAARLCADPSVCAARITLREACRAIGVEWCAAYSECVKPFADCLNGSWMGPCCEERGECDLVTWGDRDILAECTSAMAASDCSVLDEGPDVCLAFYNYP